VHLQNEERFIFPARKLSRLNPLVKFRRRKKRCVFSLVHYNATWYADWVFSHTKDSYLAVSENKRIKLNFKTRMYQCGSKLIQNRQVLDQVNY